jgi:uncharacterized protein with GYD domain
MQPRKVCGVCLSLSREEINQRRSLTFTLAQIFLNFEEVRMPYYLQQVAYSIEGWNALVKKPQDRIEAVRPAIEKLGGKIENAWFTFGDYDVVVIVQMPTNVDVTAIAIAFAAGGTCKSVKTTPLLTIDEAVEAMKKAAGCGYRPATSTG